MTTGKDAIAKIAPASKTAKRITVQQQQNPHGIHIFVTKSQEKQWNVSF